MTDQTRLPTRRSGFTLLETLVVLVMASTVLTLTAAWIARSMEGAQRARDAMQRDGDVWRLLRRWTGDIAAGQSVTSKESFVITGDDTVRYERRDRSVVRRVDGQAAQRYAVDVGEVRWTERPGGVWSMDLVFDRGEPFHATAVLASANVGADR